MILQKVSYLFPVVLVSHIILLAERSVIQGGQCFSSILELYIATGPVKLGSGDWLFCRREVQVVPDLQKLVRLAGVVPPARNESSAEHHGDAY